MKKIKVLQYALVLTALAGCQKNFLDRQLDTNYTEDQVFSSVNNIESFAVGIYAMLPAGFDRFGGGMLSSATDESVHSGLVQDVQRFNNGSWSPFMNPDEQWVNMYSGIRKANLFLERTGDFRHVAFRDTTTQAGKTSYNTDTSNIRFYRAEARFLRAFFYFELAKRYGGVPLITNTLIGTENAVPRADFNTVINFISTELTDVKDSLRRTWLGVFEDKYIGRATIGAALALKARALLYAASPLHTPGGDVAKWEAAAAAAKDVIALGQYSLDGNYRNMFRALQSNEFIFERRYQPSNTLERNTYPAGYDGAVGGTNPTQNLVDAYETSNGLAITADPAYDPQNPYAGRDPRLQMTIITNNSDYKGRKVETFVGGRDGQGKPRATRTGYYLKKFVDESLDLVQNRTSAHTWVYMRYAEVLLNYAEAMNEAYGPDMVPTGYPMSARAALNQVRSRAGVNMPPVAAGGQDELRTRIRNERRVELAFEEHRFWDVRRWRTAAQVLTAPIRAANITKLQDGTFNYQYPSGSIETRVWADKMYLYPIPQTEINKSNGVLSQNNDW